MTLTIEAFGRLLGIFTSIMLKYRQYFYPNPRVTNIKYSQIKFSIDILLFRIDTACVVQNRHIDIHEVRGICPEARVRRRAL